MSRFAPLAASFVFIIAFWESTARIGDISAVVLPAPSRVCLALWGHGPRLTAAVALTMGEAFAGFVFGAVVAFFLAVLFAHSKVLRAMIFPYAVGIKATPLIALAPVLVMWFGSGAASKVIMAALVCFFPVLVNSVDGLTAIDREAMDLMRSLSASKWQCFWLLRLPQSLPLVFSSLKVASSLAVVGAVIGEFTGSTAGIGHLINTASYYLDTDLVFAAILVLCGAGVAFFYAVEALERKVIFWRPEG